METLKRYWKKIVLGVAALVAGVALAILVFKKHITGELGDYFESEAEARRRARQKQLEEEERLRKQKEEELKKAEEEARKKQEEAEAKAKEEEERLKKLEKEDQDAFKDKVNTQLGVKEKKRGRPKKNA